MTEELDREPLPEITNVPFAAYVLERRLAVGGMSEVFLARRRDDPAKNPQKFVLKRVLPDLVEDDAIRQTFELEAKLHRSVQHPNVVEFCEYGTYAGEPFLVMEHVSGVDLSRVMARSRTEDKPLNVSMCVHIARRLCAALSAVHALCDERGKAMGVVHRDITPSNVLLSRKGEVKLGDFGIARVTRSADTRSSLALRGKYAYLSPEQVAGDPFDHRADLFSLAVVLAEMLMGNPLFQGTGQLSTLLAIKDARVDALYTARWRIPDPLFDVLCRALSKAPEDRYQDAAQLSEALAPLDPTPRDAQNELAGWVSYAADAASAARKLRGVVLDTLAATGGTAVMTTGPVSERDTPAHHDVLGPGSNRHPPPSTEEKIVCRLRARGKPSRTLHLAKLIEMLATGQVRASDEVDFGDGFHEVEKVGMLSRYLPPTTQTTRRLDGPGVPDFFSKSITETLAWVVSHGEMGVVFADPAASEDARTELYFDRGKLILTVSNEPAMLLGERLVAKGLLERSELEMAVLVMHRYNGLLGDTLIGLGLVDSMDVFQALRSQGRERVSVLFKRPELTLSFYRGIDPARVDFRLDFDVPGLLLAGLAEQKSADEIIDLWHPKMFIPVLAVAPKPKWTSTVTWPSTMLSVLRECASPTTPDAIVTALGPKGSRGRASLSKVHVLLALEACDLLGVITVP